MPNGFESKLLEATERGQVELDEGNVVLVTNPNAVTDYTLRCEEPFWPAVRKDVL